jgi:hypothetical protein
LRANSRDEAIELARQFLQVAGEGECELRRLYEANCAEANRANGGGRVEVALKG